MSLREDMTDNRAINSNSGGSDSLDLMEMSLPQVVLRVALPASLIFLMNMVFQLVDAYWVGKLGTEALAALSAASVFTWILYSVGALGEVGVQALVAQSTGAGKEELSCHPIMAGLILHALLAMVIMVPAMIYCPAIFSALGVDQAVRDEAVAYTIPFCGGMAFYFLSMIATSAFFAIGDTRTPAMVLAGALVLNAVLDPFLILGLGPFPRLGLFGAGLATGISEVVYTAWILIILRRRGLLDLSCLRDMAHTLRLALRISWLGMPIAANGVIFSGVYFILLRILSEFGTVPIATLGVAHRIEGIAWFTTVGFSVAAAALAGQLVGAGRGAQALKAVWQVTIYLSLLMVLISAIMMILGQNLTAIFTGDQAVITEGGRYLLIIGLFQIFLGWEVIFEESLAAVGSPQISFLISTPLTALRLPLAWFLAVHLNMGIVAVWWVISLTTLAKGLCLAGAFTLGSWRTKASLVQWLSLDQDRERPTVQELDPPSAP